MRLQGLVVKKTEMGENDQLITFYTKEWGKIRALARGLKKNTSKQGAHLDLLNLVSFALIGGRRWPLVVSTDSLENFPRLRSSLLKSGAVFFLLEVIDRLIYEQEPDAALWKFLEQALWRLETAETPGLSPEKLFNQWSQSLMSVMGYPAWSNLNDFLWSWKEQHFVTLQLTESINWL